MSYERMLGVMTYETKKSLGGVPIWKRGQFVTGGGLYAPGGPGGGATFGPTYTQPGQRPAGPGSCSQVPNGALRCVGAPYGEKGLETGRGWPPEIGPQEEAMMDQGCVATGRSCGGHARAQSQYWCCPGGAMIIGSPLAPTMAGLGTDEKSTPWWIYPALFIVGGAFLGLETLSWWGERQRDKL